MPLLTIDHVLLAMPAGAEDKARAFYTGVLQLDELTKPPGLALRGGAWFSNGQVTIHLGVEKDFRAARKAHPALIVQDLPGFVTRAKAQGAEIAYDDEPIEGYDRLFVYDPFGNRLELMERKA